MDIEKILNISYRMRLYPIVEDGEVEWAVEYPDLPGCVAGGETQEEAIMMAEDAKRSWLQIAFEEGKKIPEPYNKYDNEYSGKFTLRIPKSLHRELTLEAEEQNVSLNQYLLFLISQNHYRVCENQKTETNPDKFEYVETVKRLVTINGVKKEWGNPDFFNSKQVLGINNDSMFKRGGLFNESRNARTEFDK